MLVESWGFWGVIGLGIGGLGGWVVFGGLVKSFEGGRRLFFEFFRFGELLFVVR